MTTKMKIWLVAVIPGLVYFCKPDLLKAQWYENYDKGVKAVQSRQWNDALMYLNKAIAEKSGSSENARTYGMNYVDYFPYLYRGIAYCQLDELTKARVDLQKEQSLGEVNKARRDQQAKTLLSQYWKLVELKELMAAGKNLLAQGRHDEALKKFTEVASRAPNFPGVDDYLQKTNQAIDKSTKRRQQYQDSIRVAQTIQEEYQAGLKLLAAHNLDGAEQKFKHVLELDMNHAGAKAQLDKIQEQRRRLAATQLAQKEQTSTTTSTSKTATGKAPPVDNADELYRQALAYYNDGEIAKAVQLLNEALREGASHAESRKLLANIDTLKKFMDEGIRTYFAGNTVGAMQRFTEVIGRYPGIAEAQAMFGCACATQFFLTGEQDKALRDKALEAFRKTRRCRTDYKLQEKFFSPKIVALFEQSK